MNDSPHVHRSSRRGRPHPHCPRPADAGTAARPADAGTAARPADAGTAARPADAGTAARPADPRAAAGPSARAAETQAANPRRHPARRIRAATARTTTCSRITSTCGSIPRKSRSPAGTPSASGCSGTTAASSSIFTPTSTSIGSCSATTPLKYEREINAVWVDFPAGAEERAASMRSTSTIPATRRRQGRFGGIRVQEGPAGKDWIFTACEGEGAAIWWPNKDQWRDEVENMGISVAIPSDLVDVSNGRFVARPIWATATRAGTGRSIIRSTTTACR